MTTASALDVVPHDPDHDGLPYRFNAATYFIDRHLRELRGDKLAIIDHNGTYTYAELAERVNRFANLLRNKGVQAGARIALVLHDTIDFPTCFWGALKAGVVPVNVNTLLTSDHYHYILHDCQAELMVVSDDIYAKVEPALEELPALREVVVSGEAPADRPQLVSLLSEQARDFAAADTRRDDIAFWAYTSGSTGAPKGVQHRHGSFYWTARLYAVGQLGLREGDRVFSIAKLFFTYGLGNSMTFPFAVGATAILLAGRPTPQSTMEVLREHQPTVFCGVPTLYASILADERNRRDTASLALRLCVSAGEALPREIGKRWEARFGAPILDGVGTTEMLHIYLSNRLDDIRYGSSGKAVAGYALRLVDDSGRDVSSGEIGELLVKGPSMSAGYWNQPEKNRATFIDGWAHTGDKYYRDAEGFYYYCGRKDDMFKSGGNWVSPAEVEATLIEHPEVLEAAVIAYADAAGNFKPKAFVRLKNSRTGSEALVKELQAFVRQRIELWKYPRWIEFVDELPKTNTGKIQRFKLREVSKAVAS